MIWVECGRQLSDMCHKMVDPLDPEFLKYLKEGV